MARSAADPKTGAQIAAGIKAAITTLTGNAAATAPPAGIPAHTEQ